MLWWQTALMWTGGVFLALAALSTLLALWARHRIGKDFDGLEAGPIDLTEYMWIYMDDGSKPPVRVPKDLADRAIELMDAKTPEEMFEENPPMVFTLPVGAVRAAMQIAQEEPDVEIALATWMANHIKMRD